MEVILKNVRLSFPNLFEPSSFNDGAPTYNAIFLIEPGSENDKAVIKAMEKVANAKWGDKGPSTLQFLKSQDKVAHKTTPKLNKQGEAYDGFSGMHWIAANNAVRQAVVDRNPSVPLTAADGRPYAGCYVNAKVQIWAQDNKWGRRINCALGPVQFVRDGEAYGAAPITMDGLENLEAGADAESMV